MDSDEAQTKVPQDKEGINSGVQEGPRRRPDHLHNEQCCCSALQRLASPYIFGAFVCLTALLQAAASSGTGGGSLSTIEKRFQLKTSQLAPFLIVNDIVSVVMVLFVAYYGHTSHRPRIIGAGSAIVGLGLLVCTLPQFVYNTPSQYSIQTGKNSTLDENGIYRICDTSKNTEALCTEDEAEASGALWRQVALVIVGQILVGLGSSPIVPLGVTYMDDSLDRSSTSVYVACSFIATSLGPLLGYGITGFTLSKHADFYKGPVTASQGDPNWLGAWWLTYIITGVPIVVIGIPIMLFPKKMRRRATKDTIELKGDLAGLEQENGGTEEENAANVYRLNVHKIGEGKWAYVKGFLSAIRRLVTNLTFMALVFGVCAILASLAGSLSFGAKYLETQFSLSASTAPMLFGIMLTPGSLCGNLIGGFVVKKMKLSQKALARMVVIMRPFTILLVLLFFFLGCSNPDIAGITTHYAVNRTTTNLPGLEAGCNVDCACPAEYTPVCGSDGMTYATPCHAGCLAMQQGTLTDDLDKNITIYTECTCIAYSPTNQLSLSGDYDHVTVQGECVSDCNTLIPFVIVFMFAVMFSSIAGNPGFMLQLRLVEDDDRSIAVGFTSMLLRLLGFIPSPVIYGAVIQTACLLLQSSCGKTGNCLVYDIVKFRFAFAGFTVGLDVLSFVLFLVCYLSIRETKHSKGICDTEGAVKNGVCDTEGVVQNGVCDTEGAVQKN